MKRTIPIAFVALALVFASTGVSQARAAGGRGGQGGHGGGHFGGRPAVQSQPGFQGHRGFQRPQAFQGHRGFPVERGFPAHRGFQGQRHFHRGGHGGVFFGVAPFVIGGGALAYGWPYEPSYVDPGPVYTAPAPAYWYYCQSAGAYYPYVQSCPEDWVPVPAQ